MNAREGGVSPSRIPSMIPKSGHRFSDKIMPQQEIKSVSESSERIKLRSGDLAMRFSRACLVAVLLAFSFALACATAHAESLDEALAHFTADDFSETITGMRDVAASGSPRAETIVRALQEGRLMFSAERKAVYIKDDADTLTDAATGQPIAGEAPAD